MIRKLINYLFGSEKAQIEQKKQVVPQECPTQEDYESAIFWKVMLTKDMVIANIDDNGDIHFSDGSILPVDQIPRLSCQIRDTNG